MENIKEIKKEELMIEGKKFLDAGGKFVTAVCSDLDEQSGSNILLQQERRYGNDRAAV